MQKESNNGTLTQQAQQIQQARTEAVRRRRRARGMQDRNKHEALRAKIPQDFHFGHELLTVLEERYMPITTFCHRVGISIQRFYHMIQGETVQITSLDIVEMAHVLDVSPAWLMSVYMESLPNWRHEEREARQREALVISVLDTLVLLSTRDQEEIDLLVGMKAKMDPEAVQRRRTELATQLGGRNRKRA